MSNCCANSFYSTVYATPDCAVECLSAATPGAVFVGSTGRIYILTGEDPCNLSHWHTQGECCLSFTDLSDNYIVCCNEDVVFTSLDSSVSISMLETGIDFSVSVEDILPTYTFTDSEDNLLSLLDGVPVLFSGENGITVSIPADDEVLISGNTYSSASAPISNPDNEAVSNFHFDSTANQLYVWNPTSLAWFKIGNKFTAVDAQPDEIPGVLVIDSPPTSPIENDVHMVTYSNGYALWIYTSGTWSELAVYEQSVSLPVANFSYTTEAMGADLDGRSSTSTQAGVTLSYQWSGTGPGTLTFGTATEATTTLSVDAEGVYTVTLTVTDSNGFVDAHTEIFRIHPQEYCDVSFAIPDIAFADPSTPLESEVEAWVTANGPFNLHTLLYSVGDGTVSNPDHVWFYVCDE